MEALDKVALALSDPMRLQILDLLAAGRDQGCCSPDNPEVPKGVCACDITPTLEMAPSRLSYHMKALREAGLVLEQKRGKWIYYTLNQTAVREFMAMLQARYLSSCGGNGFSGLAGAGNDEPGMRLPIVPAQK